MSVSTVFMPNMHKRFRCISPRVNNWFLAFGLFEGNAKHLPPVWHTVSLRRLELSVQGCRTNTVVQDGDPCDPMYTDVWLKHSMSSKTKLLLFHSDCTLAQIHLWVLFYYFTNFTHTQYLWRATSLHLQRLSQPAISSKRWRFDLQIACHIVTALLHLFFMASFSWMLVEGLLLWSKVVSVNISEDSRMKLYYIIGWGNVAFSFIKYVKYALLPPGKKNNILYCWRRKEK